MLQLKTTKTSTKLMSGLLLVSVLLGASAHTFSPISADYKLQGEVKKALLSDPDIVDATVHIHSNGKVYIDFEDTFVSNTIYTCNEEMVRRESDIWKLVAETAGVDVRDVCHFIKGEYELKTVIEEWEILLDGIETISPTDHYNYSPQDWEYLTKRVEKGEVALLNHSQEELDFLELFYNLKRTPISWVTYPTHIGKPTPAEQATVLRAFEEFGSGSVTYFWYYDENEEPLCETSFDHLESDGTAVSYDFGLTWNITEENTLFDLDQGR